MYVGQCWDSLAGERINDGTETYVSTWRRREPVSEQDMIPLLEDYEADSK